MVWVAGHFGEWVQGLSAGGKVVLVTLACPVRGASADVAAASALAVDDPAGVVGRDRAATLLSVLGLPVRGRVSIAPDLPPGGGAGMSTAALVALARAAGGAEDRIAAACLAVEGAVDPLMMKTPDAVLWAPREARPLATMPCPPAADILGGFWGAPMATDPADVAFPCVDDLIEEWARGPDLGGAARLASLSAVRTTQARGPDGDPTPDLAARLGALGWARAHTGSARALIFAPGTIPDSAEAAMQAAGYAHVLQFASGGRA
jgi:uncharacterized protein involved in propanediol utilization